MQKDYKIVLSQSGPKFFKDIKTKIETYSYFEAQDTAMWFVCVLVGESGATR